MTDAARDEAWTVEPPPMDDRPHWDRLRRDPRHAPWREKVLAAAAATPRRPDLPMGTDYLAARRHNDRARTDRTWQEDRRNLDALMVRRALLGLGGGDGTAGAEADGDDDRLLDWLWALATQATWAVAAHLPCKELPRLREPTLDLASCEMAARLSDALIVLGPWMESVSAHLFDSVLVEIDRKVLGPFVMVCETGGAPWWLTRDVLNNWTGVCCGSLLVAACSLEWLGHPRPLVKRHAIAGLRAFLERGFTRSGECDEGLGYWEYGMSYAVTGWSRLSRAELADALDVERLAAVADYPRRAHLFGDRFYAANDAPATQAASLACVPWLAALMGEPWLAAWGWSPLRGAVATSRGISQLIGAIEAVDRAPDDVASATAALEADWTHKVLPDQQAWAGRSPRLIVTFAGGDNAENHNHNDLGHVSVLIDRSPVLVDPGNMYYTADFFSSPEKRYRYLAAGSQGHNVPIIAGQTQRPGHEARAALLAEPGENGMALDLTAAFPKEAGLTRWTREVTLDREREVVTVRDAIALARPGPVAFRWWTPHEPAVAGAAVRLGPGCLTLSPPPARIEVLRERGGDHGLREYPDDTPLYCVVAHYDAGSELSVITTIEPT